MEKNGDGDQKSQQRSAGNTSGEAMAAPPPSVSAIGSRRTHSHRDVFFAEAAEKERNMHAIAAAAVAAAQASAAVVRLTTQGRRNTVLSALERRAAITIQTMFRRFLVSRKGITERKTFTKYLSFDMHSVRSFSHGGNCWQARKALRALKGVVKLQAHVRGYLVRKEAAETLHSMQALLRAQATIRMRRAHSSSSTKDPKFLGEPLRRRLLVSPLFPFYFTVC